MWKPIEEFDNDLVDGYVLLKEEGGDIILDDCPYRVEGFDGDIYIQTSTKFIPLECLTIFCLIDDIKEYRNE